jgi:hypothetical protein
MKADEH